MNRTAKRPGCGRGAYLPQSSSGQRLREFIRHCFGIRRGVVLLPHGFRRFSLEDSRHPARTVRQPFGFAGNVAFLQLRQPGDVRGAYCSTASRIAAFGTCWK